MKVKSIELYQFQNFDMKKYVEVYRSKVAEKDVLEVEPFVPMAELKYKMGTISEEEYRIAKADEELRMRGTVVHIERKRGVLNSDEKIESKCRYLQDALIRRAFSKKDTMSFSLSSSILKAVLGHEYKRMIETFIDMGYLAKGSDFKTDEVRKDRHYTAGEHSTLYTLACDSVEKVECSNSAIIKYKQKTKEEYEKMRMMAIEGVDDKYGSAFRQHYVVSLRKVRIEDEAGMDDYIRSQVEADSNKAIYYRFVKEALVDKGKTINKVDNAGRIYHCLTNLERELKQYLNIDYMLDCKNSHPLLFNYFILRYYNISISSSYNINSFLKSCIISDDKSPIHNVGKYLRKCLLDNNIETESVAKLTDDEIEYIHLTSTGRLWDEIASRHPDLDRNEVKVQMFQEVFYSNTAYAYHWKEYAVEFQSKFPSVYRLIGSWKSRRQSETVKEYMDSRRLVVDKPTASLSVAMMDLESQIFISILKRLYARRWNAVHIHDCIVVLKDGNKNHPTIEQVRSIMESVYAEFGLCPTLD